MYFHENRTTKALVGVLEMRDDLEITITGDDFRDLVDSARYFCDEVPKDVPEYLDALIKILEVKESWKIYNVTLHMRSEK